MLGENIYLINFSYLNELTKTELILYYVILSLRKTKNRCIATNKQLSKIVNISTRQVQNSLSNLQTKKFIRIFSKTFDIPYYGRKKIRVIETIIDNDIQNEFLELNNNPDLL